MRMVILTYFFTQLHCLVYGIRARVFWSAAALVVAGVATSAVISGCGYTLQRSRSELTEREGVYRIFVEPLKNNSFKPGIENVVFNQLVRTVSVGRRVELARSKDDADAVLSGRVDQAEYVVSNFVEARGRQSAGDVNPGRDDLYFSTAVAAEYTATLGCSFELKRLHARPGQKETLWTSSFSRYRPFPASNLLGIAGNTSALINDSEFDRALDLLAHGMMGDLHESMLAMF